MQLTKRHRVRLERMAERLEMNEARLQKLCGDRTKGSQRSSDFHDAQALRAALAALDTGRDNGGM